MLRSPSNFSVKQQTYERHVVIPDLHGESELTQKVIDIYFDEADICFVFLGDLLNKRLAKIGDLGVLRTMDLVRKLGERAILTIANHEWSVLGALYDQNSKRRDAHQFSIMNYYSFQSTLGSYAIDKESSNALEQFKAMLAGLAHDKVLLEATPYYETEKFIAVHAGIEQDWDWDEQKEYIEKVAKDMANGRYELQPSVWFSAELAVDIKPVMSTDKVVVSGHAHNLTNGLSGYLYQVKTSPERVINDGRRVRLASQLNTSSVEPLYIWQDWDGEVKQILRD